MKTKNKLLRVLLFIAFLWTGLTVFVEWNGESKSEIIGKRIATKNALVVYDPDPIYNLDEQVSKSFASGLAEENWLVDVKTVAAATPTIDNEYDLYVFCANTYNFGPDRAIKNFIKKHSKLNAKPIVAITLGSGSTDRAQRILEKTILEKKGVLLDSKSYWLLRPNDESRMEESNVTVAVDMAFDLGKKTRIELDKKD